MNKGTTFVGLDVHKKTIHAARLCPGVDKKLRSYKRVY